MHVSCLLCTRTLTDEADKLDVAPICESYQGVGRCAISVKAARCDSEVVLDEVWQLWEFRVWVNWKEEDKMVEALC